MILELSNNDVSVSLKLTLTKGQTGFALVFLLLLIAFVVFKNH